MLSNSYRDALAEVMSNAMAEKDNTIIIGQGVADHKGLFGTTLGLAERYPNRVLDTPIAEDSVAGICIGAALNGVYPINTHIRADFSLLMFNQLINLAAKYKYMFGGLFEVPMMVRMIIGRSWGQGAQHSQSLQSLIAHIPGLIVLMPSRPESVRAGYKFAIESHRGPVVMLEHRLLYDLEFDNDADLIIPENPLMGSILLSEGDDVTIVATSVMVVEVMRAARYLETLGISVEVIDLHSISHPNRDMIVTSVEKTRKLLVADTSWSPFGVAAEISRLICEYSPAILERPVISLGMPQAPCPTAKALEDIYYPDFSKIVEETIKLCKPEKYKDSLIPPRQSMTDYYKHFKGPF